MKPSGPHPVRDLWRWLDPGVPQTQAIRRLRAVVLAAMATFAVSGLIRASMGGAPAGPSTVEKPRSTTGTSPPAAAQPLATGPASGGSVPVITRVETSDPVVFVTIDDGFNRPPGLAALLEELQVPVTLFLVDQAVQDGAVFFRSLPNAPVEAHTRSHRNLRSLSEAVQRSEICGNADMIARTFGRRPVLFRPPGGSFDTATQRAAASCGMAAIVLWEEVVERGEIRFRTVRELRPGDIVLLHFGPDLPDDLRMLVNRVEDAGLDVAPLEDYLSS